jgi:hypothetical protein
MSTSLDIPFFLRPEEIRDHAENVHQLDWFGRQSYALHGYALPLAAGKEFWGFITSVPRANKRTYQAHIYDCVTGEVDYGNVDWSDAFATLEDAQKFLMGLIGTYAVATTLSLWDMLGAEYFKTGYENVWVFVALSSSTKRYFTCLLDRNSGKIDSVGAAYSYHQDAYARMLEYEGKSDQSYDFLGRYYQEPVIAGGVPSTPKRVIVPAWRPF